MIKATNTDILKKTPMSGQTAKILILHALNANKITEKLFGEVNGVIWPTHPNFCGAPVIFIHCEMHKHGCNQVTTVETL